MDNPINWSFHVGRLFAINIRVHIVFVLCAAFILLQEIPKEGSEYSPSWGRILIDVLGTYGLLFLIVLLHELGHCFGARHVGGEADEILLWPLGGLAMVSPPHTPSAHMITTLAGPMVNVVLCAISSAVLVLWIGSLGAVPWNPLYPFSPVGLTSIPTMNTAQLWVIRFFGLNYMLLLFNLLPIFPFDGGRIVQAWLWAKRDYESSMLIATGTGMVAAIILFLFGLFTESSWLLLMIAVFGYLTCHQSRRQIKEMGAEGVGAFGYDFSRGYTSLEGREAEPERKPGFFERRRLEKAARKGQKEREEREQHEQQVERILRKVSVSGMGSLTARERRVLEQETERQRAIQSDSSEPNIS